MYIFDKLIDLNADLYNDLNILLKPILYIFLFLSIIGPLVSVFSKTNTLSETKRQASKSRLNDKNYKYDGKHHSFHPTLQNFYFGVPYFKHRPIADDGFVYDIILCPLIALSCIPVELLLTEFRKEETFRKRIYYRLTIFEVGVQLVTLLITTKVLLSNLELSFTFAEAVIVSQVFGISLFDFIYSVPNKGIVGTSYIVKTLIECIVLGIVLMSLLIYFFGKFGDGSQAANINSFVGSLGSTIIFTGIGFYIKVGRNPVLW
ncbi:hypothetical protein BB558_005708 [Smittium angustum]|nr:hypothetical protein BB558_005708 [Smittium angustum]